MPRLTCAIVLAMAAFLAIPAGATDHYYTWHRGNAYGYELEQTEFSREHTATPPSISYWYEGRKDGVYRLRQFNGPYIDMIRCTAPCTTVRIINAQVDKMLPLRPGTALWGAVQDMLAGKLEPVR